MDLYHKKVNIGNKTGRRPQNKYSDSEYNQPKKNQNIYIQKMIPRNENFDLVSAGENIPNVRSSMEDLFSNEDNKKRAIKYVINIGKNKSIRNSPNYTSARRFEKSASPNRGRGFGYPQGYEESYETTPNRRFPERRGESHFNNRLTTLNDYTPITYTGYNTLRRKNRFNDNNSYRNNIRPKPRNYGQYNEIDDDDYYDNQPNYINVEESNNDFELSSINDEDRIPTKLKNVEPKVYNRVKTVLNETYERAARRVRNKEINVMPKVRKQSGNRYVNKNINNNTDDEIEDLIRSIEDLQSIVNKQRQDLRNMKKDNYNKDKEINLLKNELDNMQKEMDDKRVELDKEIDDIFRNNDNSKLKNEYFKFYQEREKAIKEQQKKNKKKNEEIQKCLVEKDKEHEEKRKKYFERQLILEENTEKLMKSKEKISKKKLKEIDKKQQNTFNNREELAKEEEKRKEEIMQKMDEIEQRLKERKKENELELLKRQEEIKVREYEKNKQLERLQCALKNKNKKRME